MIEELKIQLSNTFIIEFVIDICELKISICEKLFAKRFLNLFIVFVFTNFLRFKFIKIINWFNCKTLSFFIFFKMFWNALSILRFNFVKMGFYLFISNTQFAFELRMFVKMKNNSAIFIIFILFFFVFFWSRKCQITLCVFFHTWHISCENHLFLFCTFLCHVFLRIIYK